MTINAVGSQWVSEIVFDSLGVTFKVRSTDVEFGVVIDQLTHDFGPSTDPTPQATFSVIRADDRYQLFDGSHIRIADGNRDQVLMRLLSRLNSVVVGHVTGLAVHASAASRDGWVARTGAITGLSVSSSSEVSGKRRTSFCFCFE